MTAPEPTRERVAAYEAALGCVRDWFEEGASACGVHYEPWQIAGCPVAVAAARVEAERVAEVEELAREQTQRLSLFAAGHERRIVRLTNERDALRAVVEQVRALAEVWSGCDGTHGPAILDLLPEPSAATREGSR